MFWFYLGCVLDGIGLLFYLCYLGWLLWVRFRAPDGRHMWVVKARQTRWLAWTAFFVFIVCGSLISWLAPAP